MLDGCEYSQKKSPPEGDIPILAEVLLLSGIAASHEDGSDHIEQAAQRHKYLNSRAAPLLECIKALFRLSGKLQRLFIQSPHTVRIGVRTSRICTARNAQSLKAGRHHLLGQTLRKPWAICIVFVQHVGLHHVIGQDASECRPPGPALTGKRKKKKGSRIK